MEESLRESEKKYRDTAELLPETVFEMDPTGRLTFVNRRAFKQFGYTQEEFEKGINVLQTLAPEERDRARENIQRILHGEELRGREYVAMRKDGSRFPVIIYSVPVIRENRRVGLRGILADITERKKVEMALQESQEELKHLSSQLLAVQETERRRIAHELHDGIGQILTSIKYGVEHALLQTREGTAMPNVKSSEAVISMIQQGMEEVQRMQQELRPSILDDLGILPSINWLCREFQKIYSGICIDQQIGLSEQEVPSSLRIIIFRVIQEGLNNIAKHSKANLVHLCLGKTGDTIYLVIQDNGTGFDLNGTISGGDSRKGLGLMSMKERVELSGGSYTIESALGTGTTIRASWP
jgi:PAS domain S-box-containing protein